VKVVKELEDTMYEVNARAIGEMTERLKKFTLSPVAQN
jgi:hypothetical protein